MASRWLARREAKTVAVIGAGEQARLQLLALRLVREVVQVNICARDPRKSHDLARDMSDVLGIPCRAADNVHQALEEVDIAITTTPSSEPLIGVQNLHPGLHITAMGSDAENKNEIAPAAIAAARYICDRVTQTRVLGGAASRDRGRRGRFRLQVRRTRRSHREPRCRSYERLGGDNLRSDWNGRSGYGDCCTRASPGTCLW